LFSLLFVHEFSFREKEVHQIVSSASTELFITLRISGIGKQGRSGRSPFFEMLIVGTLMALSRQG
jgi:hypothetical protein